MSHKVVGVSQIGSFRWNEAGEPMPIITDADLPKSMF